MYLVAKDTVERNKNQEKVMKVLKELEDDPSRTGGLEKLITVKVTARIMLSRNIDVSLGYANGAPGIIAGVKKGADGHITALILQINNTEFALTPVKTKFEILPNIYLHVENSISGSFKLRNHYNEKSRFISGLLCCRYWKKYIH